MTNERKISQKILVQLNVILSYITFFHWQYDFSLPFNFIDSTIFHYLLISRCEFLIFLNHLVNKLLDNFSKKIWSFPNFFEKDLEIIECIYLIFMFFTSVQFEGQRWGMNYFEFLFFGTFGCWWVKIVVSIELDYFFVLKFIHFPFVGKYSYNYNQNSPIKDFIRTFLVVLIWLSSIKLKD
jgi:hypothetical protein